MKCKDCLLSENTRFNMVRRKTGEQVDLGMYHYCPLVDDDSEVYPDDYDCVDEEAYHRLLKERQVSGNGK